MQSILCKLQTLAGLAAHLTARVGRAAAVGVAPEEAVGAGLDPFRLLALVLITMVAGVAAAVLGLLLPPLLVPARWCTIL